MAAMCFMRKGYAFIALLLANGRFWLGIWLVNVHVCGLENISGLVLRLLPNKKAPRHYGCGASKLRGGRISTRSTS